MDITFGRAVAAYLGTTGENPRKGQTHTLADVLAELADVAITALCAIQHFTGNEAVTRAVLAGKVQLIMKRANLTHDTDASLAALIPLAEILRHVNDDVPRLRHIGESPADVSPEWPEWPNTDGKPL